MQIKKLIPALALAGAIFSPLASAQSSTTTTYYAPWQGDFWARSHIGASFGESKFDSECDRLIVTECDKKDTGFRIFAGGKFSPHFGLELGYTDFGSIRASGGETDAWAIPLTLVGYLPLGDRFEVFGKFGGLYGQTDVEVAPTSLFERGHKSGWGWTYGVGASFAFTKAVALRVDWDRYELDFVSGRQDVDMMSAGLQIRF